MCQKEEYLQESYSCIVLYPTVLDEIEQHPAAKEFIEPVDRERAANYNDIIMDPMCLADMATKVLEDAYKTPKMVKKREHHNTVLPLLVILVQFCDDFDLIVSNCETYNGAESKYTHQVRQLEAEFYDLVDIYFDDSEIDIQRHRSKTVPIALPPRGPASSPSTGGEGSPDCPNTLSAPGDDGGSGSLQEGEFVQDEEREETPSNQAYCEVGDCCVTMLCSGEGVEGEGSGVEGEGGKESGMEMETGGQLPRTRTGMTPGSSGDEMTGDSEDDLPSFRNIFSTPSKT